MTCIRDLLGKTLSRRAGRWWFFYAVPFHTAQIRYQDEIWMVFIGFTGWFTLWVGANWRLSCCYWKTLVLTNHIQCMMDHPFLIRTSVLSTVLLSRANLGADLNPS